MCLAHLIEPTQVRKPSFQDTTGQVVESETRMGMEKSDDDMHPTDDSEANRLYKRMRIGLTSTVDSGELLQVQRQAESVSLNSSIFRNGMTHHGMPGPPSVG